MNPDYRPARRKEGKQWGPHDNQGAKVRRLKQRCRPLLTHTGAAERALIQRMFAATASDPLPEYAALHNLSVALETAESTGVTWQEAVEYFLTKFEEHEGAAQANFQQVTAVLDEVPQVFAKRAVIGTIVPVNVDPTMDERVIEFRLRDGSVVQRVEVDDPASISHLSPRSRLRQIVADARRRWFGASE